jgi:galactose mutarotase-like enzyme
MSLHPLSRHWGCRVTDALTYSGQTVVVLENETLRVCVLPEKGAEITVFQHKPTDTDPLFRWGSLRNPPRYPATIPDPEGTFIDGYSGGWQEVFPSGGAHTQVKGAQLGTHGEVFQLPWQWEIIEDKPDKISVRFWVKTMRTPFLLERTMSLEKSRSILTLEETVTNEGGEEMPFMWGHHPAFGAPFLDESCILDAPATIVEVNEGEESEFNRLVPGSSGNWPCMVGKSDTKIDLRKIPTQEHRSYDMFYMPHLSAGWCALTNRNKEIGVALVWDVKLFPVLWVWQQFKGSSGYPWYSQAYALGLEPFTSYTKGIRSGLAEVIRTGQERSLLPGEKLNSSLKALFYPAQAAQGVDQISPEGQVSLRK